ncbi:Cytochrome P450 72A397-like protein [Drosera capensis]
MRLWSSSKIPFSHHRPDRVIPPRELSSFIASTAGSIPATMSVGYVKGTSLGSNVNSLWLMPKKLEKCLREQGFAGNPYCFLVGDLLELSKLSTVARSTRIKLSDDYCHRVLPMEHQTLKTYGKNSFYWFGTVPRIIISDPELIREILNKHDVYQKQKLMTKLLITGLVTYEGEKWAKHRRILNPAFHMEKLKCTLPLLRLSCESMARKWEEMLSDNDCVELDVWPYISQLTGDMISRAVFSSSYQEGFKIFNLLKEQLEHALDQFRSKLSQIPGWRYVPTKRSRRMKEIYNTIRDLIMNFIEQRSAKVSPLVNKESSSDLLGMLLELNPKEVEESKGSSKGLSMEDVVEEVKLFYFAGTDTLGSSLVWAMILLSQHQDWQQRARDEVFRLFGTSTPDFDGLNRLETLTMILNEVLRLYPPAVNLIRTVTVPTRLKDTFLLPGMTLDMPTTIVHSDPKIWGEDANEFNPERFSEGVSAASRIQGSFFPYGGGSRLCIGRNLAMLEAKIMLVTILQRFSFQLSPTYTHAPVASPTVQPQFGANLVLRKLPG